MSSKVKQKGFIQIPLLIGIMIAVVIVSGATAGIVLHKQGKLAPLLANVSQVFKKNENSVAPELEHNSPLETAISEQADNENTESSSEDTLQEKAEPLVKIIERYIIEKYIQTGNPTQNQECPSLQCQQEASQQIEAPDESAKTTDTETNQLIIQEKEKIIAELNEKEWLEYSIGNGGYTITVKNDGSYFWATSESEIEILRKIYSFVLDREAQWQRNANDIQAQIQALKDACKKQGGRYDEDYVNSCQMGSQSCPDGHKLIRKIWNEANQRWECPQSGGVQA